MNKKYCGFTLVEMLVVISIIGVLVGVAIFGLRGSTENARNAQRKSDLKQYQIALENYANKNAGLYYGRPTIDHIARDAVLCTALIGSTSCPNDPLYDADDASPIDYHYQTADGTDGTASATNYVLWAKMENPNPAAADEWWVYCANGKNDSVSAEPEDGTCPL